MSQITILGSTGQIGKAILREALDAGYTVKVLVRTPDKLGDLRDFVKIVQGDLLDTVALEKALEGSIAVINAAGGVKEPDQYQKFHKIGILLTEKMSKTGVRRLVSLSGAVVAMPGEELNEERNFLKQYVTLHYKEMLDAQEAYLPAILSADSINWTYVRAPMLTHENKCCEVLADDKQMPGTKIILKELARFLVQQVNELQWVGKAPFVASSF